MFTTEDYLNLIPVANRQKPDFIAVLTALLNPLTVEQANLWHMLTDFDLDQAMGIQLDRIGLWIGQGRQLKVSIPPTYFSFDIAGLGFDQGVWFTSFEPTTEVVNLTDHDYRLVLKAKAMSNRWDGSMQGLQAILDFVNTSWAINITIIDNQNMSVGIGYTGTPPTNYIIAVIEEGLIPPRPLGITMIYSLPAF